MNWDHHMRILSLEVRYRRFGFVVLEGKPARLLDLGVRTFASAPGVLQRLQPLMSIFEPCVIVVRPSNHQNRLHRRGVQSIHRVIRREAARRSIPVEPVTVHEIRCAFGDSGKTKENIAAAVAKIFPDMHWKVPPKRKPWISEGHNMAVFDATATALAYLARSDEPTNTS